MCTLFSILEEVVKEALILSYSWEHIGGYANRQLLAEVWKMAFKILVPVRIRAALLSSNVMFSYYCFITLQNCRCFVQEHCSGSEFGVTQWTEKSPIFSQVRSSWTAPLLHALNFSILSCCSLRSVARTSSLSYETVRLHKLILEFLTKLTGVLLQSGLAEVLSLSSTCCCRKSQFSSPPPPPHFCPARF